MGVTALPRTGHTDSGQREPLGISGPSGRRRDHTHIPLTFVPMVRSTYGNCDLSCLPSHTPLHTLTHTHAYMHSDTHIHTHTYTHIYTHSFLEAGLSRMEHLPRDRKWP